MPKPLRRAHTAAAVLLVLIGALGVPVGAHAAAQPRLIVGFTSDVDTADQAATLRGAGLPSSTARAAVKGGVRALDVAVVNVPAGRLAAVRAKLLARDDVRYVEVDGVAHAFGLGDTEPAAADGVVAAGADLAAQWHPNDTRLSEQWSLAALRVEQAWETARGTGVTIAIVDTGVDYVHPDLAGRVDLGRDFVDKDDDPMDVQGHGTHVAGTAAGTADDGVGIAGIAPGARILAVRVLDAEGAGNYSQVAAGIVYAVGKGAKVINLSLGGPDESELLRAAIDYAAARGAIVTCATGNDGAASVSYPARYDSCLAVGATDLTDSLAEFSNHGAGVDLVAPGVQILSSTQGGSYDAWDGTSMATPHVSGVAALLMSQGLGRRAVLAALASSAVDLGPNGPDTTFGAGRIDAAGAVEAASRAPRAAADTVAPTVSDVTVLPVKHKVKTTTVLAWKLKKRTPFRRVGTIDPGPALTWRTSVVRGNVRTIFVFRSANGIVYRSSIVHVKTKVAKRSTTAVVPVRVTASDDVGVDRVAVQVDKVVRGIDWSAGDGWVVEVPCAAGTHEFTAWAYDTADNEGGGKVTQRVTC